jgi:molybdate transport system ATP-binding protein
MLLRVNVEKQIGDLSLRAEFAAERGVTALFGTSGSGKTSIVNMIAGLLKPDRGLIVIGDETVFDSEAGIDVPPHRRGLGYVFQEGRLFPHLNVRANLDYGRYMSGRKRDAAAMKHVVDLLGIDHLLNRRTATLSGGERQRIAIGRALLMQPRLLLLDEPLASLDDERKAEIFPYLERLRDEAHIPMIYVSHSAAEIRRIANLVVRLDDGRTHIVGGVESFTEKPAAL